MLTGRALARGLPIATLAILTAACPVYAEPLLWRVSDEDSAIHLFGTVHVSPRGTPWRTPALDDLVASASPVYFEVMLDREAVEAAAVAGALATYLPDGTRLSELLTTDQYEQLSAYLSRHDMNIETFEAYQPWAITQGLFADYSEYSPWSPGVDLILASQVDTGRMRAFETIEEQLALTLAPIEEQVVELLEMIENPPGPWRSDFDTLVHWWSSGDSQNLAELMTASLGPEDGESYRAMLTDRNRRWAIIAEELPRNNDNALIVAGVGHMVGNASLPALLAERGYTIEILQPKTLAATVRQRPLHTESYFTRR